MIANLIYRGIFYTGPKATEPGNAQDLFYRGIAHGGLTGTAPHPARAARMCCRGVACIARLSGFAQAAATTRGDAYPGAVAA